MINQITRDKIEELFAEYRRVSKDGARALHEIASAEIPEMVYNSNAIENSTLTLEDTEEILLRDKVLRDHDIREIYEAKNDESESKITTQVRTKIILLQFILEMWKKGFVIENDTSGRNTVEKEMVSYIQQNFTGKISLREFGEQFHLSEKYISRYFKEHFHITLSQYVTYLRLEHAKQLLQDTDIPVTDVAMQSGYQNVSYFIRSFQKAYAVSPLKYRKNNYSR